MCGRIALFGETTQLAYLFDIAATAVPDFPDRYNIAPGDRVLTLHADHDTPQLSPITWGISMRSKDRRISNARSETAHRTPSFSKGLAKRRCLIPARGFYEWKPSQRGKQPIWIAPDDGGMLAFAGLITEPGGPMVIMTCEPNQLIRPIHHRMPVILQPGQFDDWLNPQTPPKAVKNLTKPTEWPHMVATNVSRNVNNPTNDGPALIQPSHA